MTPTAALAAVQRHLLHALQAWGPWTRAVWCRKQRRRLGARDGHVVWVRGPDVQWAEWGARRGYFEVQYMDGLAYLRALGAPVV